MNTPKTPYPMSTTQLAAYYQQHIDYYSQLLAEEEAGSKSSRATICRRKIREYTNLLRAIRTQEAAR